MSNVRSKICSRRIYQLLRPFTANTVQRTVHFRPLSSSPHSLPRIAQPSLWRSIVPKFLKTRHDAETLAKSGVSKQWNPATFFIVIFLLIGSNAINMVGLRNDFVAFSRKTDAKIALLREVIEKVQRGEEVDVEGLLGTGNKEKEQDWENALKEIEEQDRLWQSKRKRREHDQSMSGANKTKNEDERHAIERADQGGDMETHAKRRAPHGFY